MAVVFTIYVGFDGPDGVETNRQTLFSLLSESGINGYTVTEAIGTYDGKQEPSATVILISPCDDQAVELGLHAIEVARAYKKQAKQQEVWVSRRAEDLLAV